MDAYDLSAANATCKQFLDGHTPNYDITVAVEVRAVRHTRTKKGTEPGRKMAILAISDHTATIPEAVAFPDAYAICGGARLFDKGRTLLVRGRRDLKKGNFFIDNAWPLADTQWDAGQSGFDLGENIESVAAFGDD